MNLHRKKQIIEAVGFHYILLNIFEVKGRFGFNKYFPLKLMQSNYFKIDAQADAKKLMTEDEKSRYLPFPFNTDNIELIDFKQIISATTESFVKELVDLYIKEMVKSDLNSEFDEGFKYSIELIKNALNSWEENCNYYVLTIGNFENDSSKIHSLYHDTNFIHDYFYFAIGINEHLNEVVMIEFGFE